MQPATTGAYAGLKIAYLPRNSTPRQDGNYSQRRQSYSIADHITAGGGVPVAYDEGIASGRDLGKRTAALRALDAIAAGELHGLAWEKIDRVTRDEFGTDAGLIAETLFKHRGLLVTLDRDYRLWRTADLKAYRDATGDAGVELLTIRDRLWGGVLEKAREEAFFMGVPPFGYTTRLEEQPAGGRRGGTKVVRVPVKDERAAPLFAAVASALDACTALGEAVAMLNSQGHFRWAVAGEARGIPTRWQLNDLRRMLEYPIYGGWWTLGRASDGSSSIWESAGAPGTHGGRIPALAVPELAWFTPEQLAGWRAKYPRKGDKSGPRHRKAFYPLRGVLACLSCGRPLAGWRAGYYACTQQNGHYADRRCDKPQYLSEAGAVRALVTELPRALAAVKQRHDELAAAVVEDDELDALRRRWDIRTRQSEALVAQAFPDDWDGTPNPAVAAKLAMWQRDILELTDQIERRERALASDPERMAVVEAVLADPGAVVVAMPAAERLTFLRLVFAEVRISATGWAAGRRYQIEGYRNRWLADEVDAGSACSSSVYQTILSWLGVPE